MKELRQRQAGSVAGIFVFFMLVAVLVGMGVWMLAQDGDGHQESAADITQGSAPASGAPVPPEAPLQSLPMLAPAAAYVPRDGVVEVDISEYAGYAGLVVANGGLEPNPDSIFAREYGFQVRLSLSEEEGWSKLNSGQVGASVTTADVLAVLGRQFEVKVPAQIAFSRGANQVVVDQGITSINQLKGKVLAASQFNESDFFIRYLASEAGVPIRVLDDLDARPGAAELGLVFYEDAVVACDAYAQVLEAGTGRLNGCVGWSPRTDQVVAESRGLAKMLVSNRNLLVIADLLLVNKGFADSQPRMVEGLVHGLMEGNRQLRETPEAHLALVGRAFGWSEDETRDELGKVHFSNVPENKAFFAGTIDSAGSYQGIFQSSVLAYGSLIRNPSDPARFVDLAALQALDASGIYADQSIAIAPIKTHSRVAIEGDALLSKDIRFFFNPNSAVLDARASENQAFLDDIKRFLQVSPGSMVLLRGHVDDQSVPEFERQGGPALVRTMAMKAMELSRQRTQAVADALLERHPDIERDRIELVGRGWEEPVGSNSDLNRRVEVQWFTLE